MKSKIPDAHFLLLLFTTLIHMACHAHTYRISDNVTKRQNNLLGFSMKDVWSWSDMCTATTEGTHIKLFPICPETLRSKRRKKKTRKTISKLFKLTNAKIIYGSSFYFEHILKGKTFLDKVLNIRSSLTF